MTFQFVTVLKTGGEYSTKHVTWLQRQVNIPIICLTDSTDKMENVTSIPLKYNFPKWWSKLEMFRPDIGLDDFLYSDLDAVFTHGLPEKYTTLKQNVVLACPCLKFKPSIYSGMMNITKETSPKIWDGFISDPKTIMDRYALSNKDGTMGDQGYLNEHLATADRWQALFPNEFVSFKKEVAGRRLPKNANVVIFYSHPRPWETGLKWVPRL